MITIAILVWGTQILSASLLGLILSEAVNERRKLRCVWWWTSAISCIAVLALSTISQFSTFQ